MTHTSPSPRTGLQTAVGGLSALLAVGVALQAFFAMSAFSGAGSSALDIHKGLGNALLGVAVVIGVAGFMAFKTRPGLRHHALAITVMGVAQVGLARADSWAGGLHGLLAVVIGIAAAALAGIVLRSR